MAKLSRRVESVVTARSERAKQDLLSAARVYESVAWDIRLAVKYEDVTPSSRRSIESQVAAASRLLLEGL